MGWGVAAAAGSGAKRSKGGGRQIQPPGGMEDMDLAGVAELMRGLGLGGIVETVEAEQLTGLMLLQLIKRDGGLAAIGAENVLSVF